MFEYRRCWDMLCLSRTNMTPTTMSWNSLAHEIEEMCWKNILQCLLLAIHDHCHLSSLFLQNITHTWSSGQQLSTVFHQQYYWNLMFILKGGHNIVHWYQLYLRLTYYYVITDCSRKVKYKYPTHGNIQGFCNVTQYQLADN